MKTKGLPWQTTQIQGLAARLRSAAEELDLDNKPRTVEQRLTEVKQLEARLLAAIRANSRFWGKQIKDSTRPS